MSEDEIRLSGAKALEFLLPGDDFLSAMGRVIAICAHIEVIIGNIVCVAIGADQVSSGRFLVSQVAYSRLSDVLVRTVEHRLGGNKNADIRAIQKRTDDVFRRRNEIVHGTLMGHPFAELYVLANNKVPFSPQAFRQISRDEVSKLATDAASCFDELTVFFRVNEAALRTSTDKSQAGGN